MEFDNDDARVIVTDDELQLLLKELRQRINETEFPVVPRTDDEFLVKFIRTKNYKIESAFDSVRRYYANVYRNLNFIKGIRPSDFKESFYTNTITIIKERHEGARVGICAGRNWNPKQNPLRDMQLSAVFIVEEGIKEIETQENGIIVIFDLGGLRWEQIKYLTAREIKRILVTGQEGLPLKVKQVHLVNPPPLFWTLHKIGMRFVKDKIRKRVHLHYSWDSLHKFLPKKILPKSLGGERDEEEIRDTELNERILRRNAPYERYWSGAKPSRKLSRKRSSAGDILVIAQ